MIAGQYPSQLVVCDSDRDVMRRWIEQGKFKRYEDESYKVETAVSGRVSVYIFYSEAIDKDVVMKVSAINPRYKLSRKVELLLRRLLRGDHNAAAFYACRAWSQLGVPVCHPIAYWASGSGFAKKTYFMYEKTHHISDGETVLRDLQASANPDARRCYDALLAKMFSIICHIHKLGWRHGDPVPKNFLFDLPVSVDALCAQQIDDMEMRLIDYDGAHEATLKLACLKQFFDMRDLRGFLRLGLSEEQTLKMYGLVPPSSFWQAALRFWVREKR